VCLHGHGRAHSITAVHTEWILTLALLTQLTRHMVCMYRAPLQAVQAVAIEAVMPIFKAMVEAAEEIILRLHSEGFADEGQQGMTQASAYMQALTTHLTHCRSLLCLSSLCPSHLTHCRSLLCLSSLCPSHLTHCRSLLCLSSLCPSHLTHCRSLLCLSSLCPSHPLGSPR